MNNSKITKVYFFLILASLFFLYQANILDSLAFDCEHDKIQDVSYGKHCCLNSLGGDKYQPVVQSSSCNSNQLSFGQKKKDKDGIEKQVCPCNDVTIH